MNEENAGFPTLDCAGVHVAGNYAAIARLERVRRVPAKATAHKIGMLAFAG